jgi:hypothetical protein
MNSVFKNEFAEISYEDDLKLIIIKWTNKTMSFNEYQKPFEIGIKFMKEKPVVNFISDIRKQSVISLNYRKWLQDFAIPEATEAGLERVVCIANITIIKRFYINKIYKSTKRFGIPIKIFNSIDKAKEWLLKFE